MSRCAIRAAAVMAVCGGLLLTSAVPVRAETIQMPSHAHTVGGKLLRGSTNLLLGWWEVPKHMHSVAKTNSWFDAATWGLGEGLLAAGVRTVCGVYELVTFPFLSPKDYVPALDPEYIWETPSPRY